MASEPSLTSLADLAASSSSTLSPDSHNDLSRKKDLQKRQFIRSLHRVIDESDIIILVLDARDPQGCRSRLVEEEVQRRESEGKKLVFVLNKIVSFYPPSSTTNV